MSRFVFRFVFGLIVALLVLSLFVAPTVAQETATSEPTGEVTPPAEQVPSIPPASETIRLSWQTFALIVISTLATGITLTLAGVTIFVRTLRSNNDLSLAIERLYMSAPVETRLRVRGGVNLGKEIFDYADELTDGQLPPGARAPTTPSPTS